MPNPVPGLCSRVILEDSGTKVFCGREVMVRFQITCPTDGCELLGKAYVCGDCFLDMEAYMADPDNINECTGCGSTGVVITDVEYRVSMDEL